METVATTKRLISELEMNFPLGIAYKPHNYRANDDPEIWRVFSVTLPVAVSLLKSGKTTHYTDFYAESEARRITKDSKIRGEIFQSAHKKRLAPIHSRFDPKCVVNPDVLAEMNTAYLAEVKRLSDILTKNK